MKKYIIEREIPNVGMLSEGEVRDAAAKSNDALQKLGPQIQWLESFVAADKTYCVYLAKDEEIIQQHARLSGFPANAISEIKNMIDSTSASPDFGHCFGSATREPSR